MKNGFFQKLPDTICVRKGEKRISCTLSVLAQKIVWPKTVETMETLSKNSGWFQRKLPQTKNVTFFEKGVLLTWVKKWFY